MTYIDRLNEFHRWCENNDLPVNAKLLYFNFLNAFNREKWPGNLRVDTTRLMLLSCCQKSAAFRMRDKLVEAGFLGYRKGKKGRANVYFLCSKETKTGTERGTESGPISGAANGALRDRGKKKREEKDTPPISPQGESEGFQRFWELYPRKIARGPAGLAWEKLAPGEELQREILSAVREQSSSPQWRQEGGRFVPSPARWLEERRWEHSPAPSPPEPRRTYDIDELEELAGFWLPEGM